MLGGELQEKEIDQGKVKSSDMMGSFTPEVERLQHLRDEQ